MRRQLILLSVIVAVGFFLGTSQASAVPVDLTTFTPSPEEVVLIALDGSSATLGEDENNAPVSLVNLAFQIPSNALSFSFDYALVVASANEDYFDFYFADQSNPIFSVGGVEDSYSGSYNLNVTPFRGDQIPIIFGLSYGWDDIGYDSTLTISNVEINPVPEPATLFLMSAGLAGLMGLRRKFYS